MAFRILCRRSGSTTVARSLSKLTEPVAQRTQGRNYSFFTSSVVGFGLKNTSSSSRNTTFLVVTGVVAGFVAGGLVMTIKPEPLHCETPPSNIRTSQADYNLKRESGVTENSPIRLRMEAMIRERQREIVEALEKVDGKKFLIDTWERPDVGGGGGISCVLQDGNVFEKAGVNISIVYGKLPPVAVRSMRAHHKSLDPTVESLDFFAAGLSMVLHPKNPMAPTVHLNYRYFETMNDDGTTKAWWFGGGTDLTPSYLFEEDAILFHKSLKEACDRHDPVFYRKFKNWCDEYFYVKHRHESRGIGGIFFDDLEDREPEKLLAFSTDCLDSFLPSYLPIIEKRKDMPFTPEEKQWQQLRRGRYVEFNLIYDRGTAFGLNTPNARVESILMSLPLTAGWQYMHSPAPGSREQRMLDVLKNPREWV